MRPLFMFIAGAALLLALALSGSCGGSTLLDVGAAAPDVTVTDMNGQALSLASLRGRTVLLNFWFYH